MIPPSKKKGYVGLADIGHKAPSVVRPCKQHENKKSPPELLGAILTFQRQTLALPNAYRKTHLEINFFLCRQQGKLLHV